MENENIQIEEEMIVDGGTTPGPIEEVPIKATPKTSKKTKSPKPPKEEKNPKRVFISIDKTYEDVIQYQYEGYSIFFDDTEGQFLELATDQIKELNPYNQEKYRIAKAIIDKNLNLSSIKTSHMMFEPKAAYASATNRLKVENGRPGMQYSWFRPDGIQEGIYEGYQVCQDRNVKTFGNFDIHGDPAGKESTHYVKANGEIELVLMEIPKERHDARRKNIEALSRRRNEAVDNQVRADLEAMGGDPVGAQRSFDRKN